MPTPYEVPSSILIEKLSRYIKDNIFEIKPPSWVSLVKTGTHRTRAPQNLDWWFVRSASVLRKIYIKQPIGIEHLRSEYGGRKRSGVKPEHSRKGSGSLIRKSMQQFEKAGLVEKTSKGRILTKRGRQLMDKISTEIKKELEKEIPEIKKY